MRIQSVSVLLFVLITVVLTLGLACFKSNIQATSSYTSVLIGQQNVSGVVFDMGRVPKSGAFNYTATQPGSYDLVFSNEFDVFSLIVWYNISWPSGNVFLMMEVPFNETHFITANLDVGQTVSGNFSVSGGFRYDDIHFFIRLVSTPTPTPTSTATPTPTAAPTQSAAPTPVPPQLQQ